MPKGGSSMIASVLKVSEVLGLLRVQLGRPVSPTSENFHIVLINLMQRAVWEQAYKMNEG
jgi:hypothetical protein